MHNRKIRLQYATVITVFIAFSAFSVFASTALHNILIGKDRAPRYYPIGECIKSIEAVEKHRLLFLCLLGFSFFVSAALLLSYSRSYISRLNKITPDIYTPAAVGQNQHGSARWMKEKDKARVFQTAVINPKEPLFRKLIEAGKADKATFKKHVITGDGVQKKKRTGILIPKLKAVSGRYSDIFLEVLFPQLWRKKEQRRIEKELSLIDDGLFEDFEDFETGENEITNETAGKSLAGSAAENTGRINKRQPGGETEKLLGNIQLKEGGIVLGKKKLPGGKELIYYSGEDGHIMCLGATRSGKSRTLVIQSICLIGLSGESMIISDLKGELNQYTGEFLKRLGYKVVVLDFKNPLKSDRYNLLQPVIDAIDDDNIPLATECVWDLVGILVGEAKGEKIWTNGEASTIACAIMAVVYDNREAERRKYQTLTNVYYFIAEMCKPVNKKLPIVEYVKQLPYKHPAKPLVAISEIAPERTRGSFYTAALTTLKLFTSSYLNAMTMKSDYNPKELGREKTALFFVLPDDRPTYYSIASILVLQHYIQLVNESDTRGGRLKKRVNLVLDEFGNFAPIPYFDTLLTVGGGRGIRFNLFIQDFAQLESKYDEKVAKTIKGNCHIWDYLQSDENGTLKEISEKLGQYTTSTYSLSTQTSKYQTASSTASVNLTGRALLMTEEIQRITRPYSLITSRADPVIMYSPDLSKWHFNTMLGLGGRTHNEKARDYREKQRPERITKQRAENIELWSEFWKHWQEVCEGVQEPQAQPQPMPIPIRRTIRRDEDYY
ncbi:type IV secretion system protein VirD4 [Ruminiclostridium sufflavum DSM 19573]|uniref:Type IV secretion system protein VirD4 n=1 Tax=Ruminiclostridium sufflavum DSM 19573 TaxID=1121337 RepID=A0A318XG41_9FIRM|nr:type IV secretory system conjugative DNA transfer family protein [Ruminiclostridium sufflavum]PYG84897.1 type IV secretion system protein VirD4 [Ruminiclostridium sufflavum DSM 19573]